MSLEDPYNDNAFNGFKILVVCLYMEANEKVNLITREVFDENCGNVLKKKGFSYTFVCSYGEGINELTQNQARPCPYSELWLFSSAGIGVLPEEATDPNINKIIPFLQVVSDFWSGGGGLLLFCDSEPYNFEVNYLLSHFLNFNENGSSYTTKVRLGGFYEGQQEIRVGETGFPLPGTFLRKKHLDPPGKCTLRMTLRPGLVSFNEGNTISYAVDENHNPLINETDLRPFSTFAYISENSATPKPFILYYDPPISEGGIDLSPGPIVLHGGFTSAFYDFVEDVNGTGRLIISIAAWLTRFEERHYLFKIEGKEIFTTPTLHPDKYKVKYEFTEWIQPP